jgi:thymidylate synthase
MNNIDRQYKELLDHILNFGIEKQDRTGTGTKSIFGWQIRHNMKEGFPLLTTKKMAWKSIVTELLWFLRGDTNIRYLVDNDCHIWDGDAYKAYKTKYGYDDIDSPLSMGEFITKIKTDNEFAKENGDLGPIYGKQWRKWKGKLVDKSVEFDAHTAWVPEQVDQIANLISELKTNPDSRRLMVSAWNVAELDQMVLPPCHYGFQVYTRELSLEERRELVTPEMHSQIYNAGDSSTLSHSEINQWSVPTRTISLMWNQRSVDTFLGLPFNIASYGLLLEIIAESVNMIPDELIGNLGDVHLYNNHLEQAKEQCNRTPYDLPKLNINTEFWPTEGGSCGEGLLDAVAVFNSFKDDNFCKCLLEEDIQLYDYQSHPAIKAPLSN